MSDQAAKIKDTLLKKHNERTKEASISKKLTDMVYKLGLKPPSLNKQLTYGYYRGTPGVAGLVGGALGGALLGQKLLPHLGIEGSLLKQNAPEILAGLGITGGASYAGGNLGVKLLDPVGKRLARKYTPETAKYFNLANPYGIGMPKMELNLSKQANLSRAAKGAIAAPLAVMGAAAVAPGHLFGDIGHLISGGAGKLADPTALQKITEVLAGTGSRIGFNPYMNTDAAMLLGTAGISGLGAGVGKLSEKLISLAKKSKDIAKVTQAPMSLMGKFKASSPHQKALIAAALFPWTLAAGAGAYALSDSDS